MNGPAYRVIYVGVLHSFPGHNCPGGEGKVGDKVPDVDVLKRLVHSLGLGGKNEKKMSHNGAFHVKKKDKKL